MNIATLREALLYCTIINFGVLAIWGGVAFLMPNEWMYRLWSRKLRMTVEQFNAINLAGIVLYEIVILMFNLVPWLALQIVQ
ncbi:MAG: hypothetical protein IPJ07_20245 [Acidobacteria bacterium]|nr:hypothetical protein [Acidobacteriota bacterium]